MGGDGDTAVTSPVDHVSINVSQKEKEKTEREGIYLSTFSHADRQRCITRVRSLRFQFFLPGPSSMQSAAQLYPSTDGPTGHKDRLGSRTGPMSN